MGCFAAGDSFSRCLTLSPSVSPDSIKKHLWPQNTWPPAKSSCVVSFIDDARRCVLTQLVQELEIPVTSFQCKVWLSVPGGELPILTDLVSMCPGYRLITEKGLLVELGILKSVLLIFETNIK